jgi:hemolysin activation/secretion protein
MTIHPRTIACLIAIGVSRAATAQELALPPLAPSTQEAAMLSSAERVRVDRLLFEGNTAFTSAELLSAKIGDSGKTVSDLLGKNVSLDDLEAIRVALTLKYTDAGYINSGAVVPDQPIPADGALRVQIVEGRLSDINIEGKKRLRDGYLIDRIHRGAGVPLNVFKLRDQLEILRQDPKLKRINAELRPGNLPGEALLDVAVEQHQPFKLALLFSNRRPPSVGAERFELFGGYEDVLGIGDAIRFRYGINKGELDDWEFAGADDFSIGYSIPVSPSDTTISFDFDRSDSTIVEPPFDLLDLDTTSDRYALSVRQPMYRTSATEFALFGALTVQHTINRIAGLRQDVSPGSIEGESNVTAIRFGQEFLTRSSEQAVSLRSTFSLGIDAFESNVSAGEIADSQFVVWLGQAQYVRRLSDRGDQFVARVAMQLSPDSLLGPEQFAIGGMDTVRGYRENQVVRDNGIVGTMELRIPIITKKIERTPILEFAPFIDAGYAFNRDQQPAGEYLISVGAGMLFNPNEHFNATLYYGRRLNDVSDDGGNLQDNGIHFSITVSAF